MIIISNYLNSTVPTIKDSILIAVISSLLVIIIVTLIKNIFIKVLKPYLDKMFKIIKIKIRHRKGKFSLNEIIEIEEKKKKGEKLSSIEEKAYNKNREQLVKTLQKCDFNDVKKSMHATNMLLNEQIKKTNKM